MTDAPERLHMRVSRDTEYPGEWLACGHSSAEAWPNAKVYILHAREALAADPLVQEMIAEAVEDCKRRGMAAAIEMVLEEREACAKVAEDDDGHFTTWGEDRNTVVSQQAAKDIAAAIRARGE